MRCEPANTIIKKFKGLKPLAKVTNVTVHTVMRWRMPKDKGGTGGIVPHWHIPAILEAAKVRGLDVRASDFAPVILNCGVVRDREVFDVSGPEDVRKLREALGLSRVALADLLCRPVSTVCRWEEGSRSLKSGDLADLRELQKAVSA